MYTFVGNAISPLLCSHLVAWSTGWITVFTMIFHNYLRNDKVRKEFVVLRLLELEFIGVCCQRRQNCLPSLQRIYRPFASLFHGNSSASPHFKQNLFTLNSITSYTYTNTFFMAFEDPSSQFLSQSNLKFGFTTICSPLFRFYLSYYTLWRVLYIYIYINICITQLIYFLAGITNVIRCILNGGRNICYSLYIWQAVVLDGVDVFSIG